MRKIQNSTQPDSNSDIDCETGDVIEGNGWETEFDSISSKEERSKDFGLKLIKIADKKVNLANVFKSFNINFENIVQSPSGWTHNRVCPFKDHQDRSPSFWYNPSSNCFNCFGCSRGGGPVNFLSIHTNRNKVKIAEEILSKYSDLDEICDDITDEIQEKIDDLIMNCSDYFKIFMKKHSDNPKLLNYAENLLWSLDVYLEKLNFAKTSVELENLEARINILKRKLDKVE